MKITMVTHSLGPFSGLPIITSLRTGTVDIIRDGENGLIVTDPTNIDELSQKMLLLLEDHGGVLVGKNWPDNVISLPGDS